MKISSKRNYQQLIRDIYSPHCFCKINKMQDVHDDQITFDTTWAFSIFLEKTWTFLCGDIENLDRIQIQIM